MARDVTIEDPQIVYITFDEAEFPGWEPGEKVQGPVEAPDGTIYHFAGDATVEGVVLNAGHKYDVQITHVPATR